MLTGHRLALFHLPREPTDRNHALGSVRGQLDPDCPRFCTNLHRPYHQRTLSWWSLSSWRSCTWSLKLSFTGRRTRGLCTGSGEDVGVIIANLPEIRPNRVKLQRVQHVELFLRPLGVWSLENKPQTGATSRPHGPVALQKPITTSTNSSGSSNASTAGRGSEKHFWLALHINTCDQDAVQHL